jgi:TrmH family RNA methyltransferase
MIADGISDPGNLGTIIRTLTAFNYDMLITVENSAEVYNPKVIRATQGTFFHIDIIPNQKPSSILNYLKETHKIISVSLKGNTDPRGVMIEPPFCVVIGSEIKGVNKQFEANSDYIVKIPISHKVESLNAAVAAGIILYELNKATERK